jgi:signal peptidase I
VSGKPSAGRVFGAIAAALLIAICVAALAWRGTGGRWFVVRTPSMGQAAPVGTLLLTRPTSESAVHVGDIITFHAPGSGLVYSHRVVAKTAAGIQTKGDINSSTDPWTLTNQDLIGQVTHRWWDVGWILRGLPLLLACLAFVWLLAAFMARHWRSPVRIVGTALSFAITAAFLRPWVGLVRLGVTGDTHAATVRVVSTGILPVHAIAVDGGARVRLVDGQVGAVPVKTTATQGSYHIKTALSLTPWWWVAVIAICLLPVVWALLVGLEPAVVAAHAAGRAESEPDAVDVVVPDTIDELMASTAIERRSDVTLGREAADAALAAELTALSVLRERHGHHRYWRRKEGA